MAKLIWYNLSNQIGNCDFMNEINCIFQENHLYWNVKQNLQMIPKFPTCGLKTADLSLSMVKMFSVKVVQTETFCSFHLKCPTSELTNVRL